MGDLISRQALLKDFQKTITENSDTMDWINMINRQPTAYDVDKVVEQIEVKILELKEKIMSDAIGENTRIRWRTKMSVFEEVLELVKAGGVNG